MLFTNALIRRYTPPTCTLEIWGKRSLLSIWAGRNLLKDVGFQLYLDDPRQAEREAVVIKGDRHQLQSLCDLVSNYTQNLLQFPGSAISPMPRLTHHQLSLDSLALNSLETTLNLSVTQLFDLANALDEYSQESELLPQLDKTLPRKALLTWTVTAAALLSAFGLPFGIRYWQQNQAARMAKNNLAVAPRPAHNSLEIPSVPLPPSPLAAPSIPPTITEQQPLPPPGGIQPLPSPSRNPNIPVTVPPPPVLPPLPLAPVAPAQTAIVIAPNAAPLPPAQVTPAPAQVTPETVNLNPPAPILPKLPPLEAPKSSVPTVPQDTQVATTKPSLLDTIPQVAQVRQYFQERWQPPESLKQTLEYRLILNKDGALERIVPLGEAAKVYLDRTNMPLLGEPFVSALEPSLPQNPQIRLVLSPDRTVRTFMEQP